METKINEITISIPYENREIVINGLIDNLIRVNHEGMPGDRVTIRFRTRKKSGMEICQNLIINLY